MEISFTCSNYTSSVGNVLLYPIPLNIVSSSYIVRMEVRAMSQFAEWFKAQFGALPMTPITRQAVKRSLELAQAQVAHYQQKLDKDEALTNRWTAALYAKQAVPSNFSC